MAGDSVSEVTVGVRVSICEAARGLRSGRREIGGIACAVRYGSPVWQISWVIDKAKTCYRLAANGVA